MPATAKKPALNPQTLSNNPQVEKLMRDGWANLNSGNLFQAEQMLKQASKMEPVNLHVWHMLSQLATVRNDHAKSVAMLEKALEVKPNSAETWNNLGTAHLNLGKFEKAVSSFRKAVRHQPETSMFHSNLGSALHQCEKHDEALKCINKAIHLDNENIDAYYNLAVIHTVLGDKKARTEACQKALSIKPDFSKAFQVLALTQKWETDKEPVDCAVMIQMFEDENVDIEDRMRIGFGLGKIYDDIGDGEKAYDFFTRSNRMKRQTFTLDMNQVQNQYALIKKQFTREWLDKYRAEGHRDDTPIFIIGMPRSGTTLVEQILNQHSQIHGAGERTFIPEIINTVERDVKKRFPTFMDNIPLNTYQQMGEYYVKRLREISPGEPKHIVDKLPGNYSNVGFIKAILPQAKFIYCKRDPFDNALSNYKRLFAALVPFAYDMYEIGRMANLCEEIMEHWMETLDDSDIFEVVYEELVKDVESKTKQMLEFVGVPWEDACLNFHKSNRPVNTASYEQVRQPIYSSSIGVWKKNERYLEPLKLGMEHWKGVLKAVEV